MPQPSTCTDVINLRYQDGSEGSPSNPAKYNQQDYEHLKDLSRRRGKFFYDSTFPPDMNSLGDLPSLSRWQQEEVKWLRPVDIMREQNINKEPSFFVEGASRFDFSQGKVGNCWFLAAIASLTFQKDLMVQVVPLDQTFKDNTGIFHFRFWRFGKWVDVVIDDYLPTFNRELLSVRSKTGNEFWVPLLEKAYAKVCGSYADMHSGHSSEAFKDFSGGVHMTYKLKDAHTHSHDAELWASLTRATGCKSMICCGTSWKGDELVNSVSHTGLVDGHAYSVTAVTEVDYYGSKARLVRLMNPWGSQEWKGKWSDSSNMWDKVSSEDRAKCVKRHDGEFWMELEDFCYYFNELIVCCENPNFIDGDLTCQWKCMIYDNRWVAGRNAGGNVNEGTFSKNPQYRLKVKEIDRTEKADKNVLLSLMQKPAQRHRTKARFNPIGLTVFQVPPGTPQGRLGSSFFRRQRPVKDRQLYTDQRDLIELHSLQPADYVIIPSTMKPNTNADFVLTVYSKANNEINVHDGDDDDDDHDHDHGHDHDHDNERPVDPKPSDNDKENNSTYLMFKRYADQNGELSDIQLQKLLNDQFHHGSVGWFDLNTCRSMIALMDTDRRKKMSYTEFLNLWNKFEQYKEIFDRADVSKTGTLSYNELQNAIRAAGIELDDSMVVLMMFRYSGYSSSTSLDSFLPLMLRLENLSTVFTNRSSDGVIHLDWNEWTDMVMYS